MSKTEIKKFKCNSEDGCTELLHNVGIFQDITFQKIVFFVLRDVI